ncbi:MAG: pteridine reductase [Gammaproteobacteria bacterium]|nr:MAG: pteridine reductase [Gammaproteobacteria bacterium]
MSERAQWVLVTGGARRIGRAIVKAFHARGFNVWIHYRDSQAEAESLAEGCHQIRQDSARTLRGDLTQTSDCEQIVRQIKETTGLNVLVNNASAFYPTPVESATMAEVQQLWEANAGAAFRLTSALTACLRAGRGSVVNIIDAMSERAQPGYVPYQMAKAGMMAMTRGLAVELAPDIRVNAVSPGAILWPEGKAALDEEARASLLREIPLKRLGQPEDIAQMVVFLACDAHYVTGQVIAVDGGRSLAASVQPPSPTNCL